MLSYPGSWAWYGSGYPYRLVGSGYTCHACYWTMSLPHVTMITTYDGEQDICLYGGSYIDIIQSFGMKSGLTPGTSTVYSNLYGQGNCCNGGSCCNCDDCGGQLYANVEVESSGANGEIGLMLT